MTKQFEKYFLKSIKATKFESTKQGTYSFDKRQLTWNYFEKRINISKVPQLNLMPHQFFTIEYDDKLIQNY